MVFIIWDGNCKAAAMEMNQFPPHLSKCKHLGWEMFHKLSSSEATNRCNLHWSDCSWCVYAMQLKTEACKVEAIKPDMFICVRWEFIDFTWFSTSAIPIKAKVNKIPPENSVAQTNSMRGSQFNLIKRSSSTRMFNDSTESKSRKKKTN